MEKGFLSSTTSTFCPELVELVIYFYLPLEKSSYLKMEKLEMRDWFFCPLDASVNWSLIMSGPALESYLFQLYRLKGLPVDGEVKKKALL